MGLRVRAVYGRSRYTEHRVAIGCCAVVAGCLFPFGCERERGHRSDEGAINENRTVLTVFAAASTKEVIEALAVEFGRTWGVTVNVSLGPSNQLAMQIIQGAPADIFLSASVEWAERVVPSSPAASEKRFLSNRLVIVAPRGNVTGIRDPNDLAGPKIKRIALPAPHVPAGRYAEQALMRASVLPAIIEQGKIVTGGDVRVTLSYVERGEVEAGVVYATDAKASSAVEVVYVFDEGLHEPIRYPILLMKRAEHHEAAKQFFDFLSSPRGCRAFEAAGFLIVD